jgi:hypothetical protein
LIPDARQEFYDEWQMDEHMAGNAMGNAGHNEFNQTMQDDEF